VSDIWEESWPILEESFHKIADRLVLSNPKLSWSCGHFDNETFPFRAYASFNHGAEGAEDIVASVDVRRSDGKLRYSSDIGLDDGRVLADGPTGIIDASTGTVSAKQEIGRTVRAIARFIDSNEALFLSWVMPPS
jgi:hypothetical protein